VRSDPSSRKLSRTHPWLRCALGLTCASALGCSRSPWPAALVPVVSFVLDQQLMRGRPIEQRARRLGALSVRVLLTFDGAALRPVLPTPLDEAPALYALPCEDDDASCLIELAPEHPALARASGAAP
jgi:hypothetical protein